MEKIREYNSNKGGPLNLKKMIKGGKKMTDKNDEKLMAEMEEDLEDGDRLEEEIFPGEIEAEEYHESVSHEVSEDSEEESAYLGELGDNETKDEFEVESDNRDDKPSKTIDDVEEEEAIELDEPGANPFMQRLLQLPKDIIKDVIGKDDRKRQKDTKRYPNRCICYLSIKFPKASIAATGFLVSKRTVITNGHCVYRKKYGGWATSIKAYPGRDGDKKPFGEYYGSKLYTTKGWKDKGWASYDYAAIILTKNPGVGWFGFGYYKWSKLKNLNANTTGYPSDKKPPRTQWWNSNELSKVFPRSFRYKLDTFKGQSGSPVWWYKAKKNWRSVVGIHKGDYSTKYNYGIRISRKIFDRIKEWKQKGD
jgi:V8-like Glu-specific endopeptidase